MTSLSSSNGDARIAEFAGFAIVVLFVITILVAPSAELLDPEHSLESLAKAYSLHRSSVLAGSWIATLTWVVAFLVFAGALSSSLSGRGGTSVVFAWVGLAGAVVESLAILVFILLSQAAAFTADVVEPAVVLLLHQTALLANNLSGFPTIVCVAAYTLGLTRIGALPSWVIGLSVLCIAAHALSTVSLAAEGLGAPSGLASIAAPFTMTAWVLGVSIVVRSRRRAAQQAVAADGSCPDKVDTGLSDST